MIGEFNAFDTFVSVIDNYQTDKLSTKKTGISVCDGELLTAFEAYLQQAFCEGSAEWDYVKGFKRLDIIMGAGSTFFRDSFGGIAHTADSVGLQLQHTPKSRPAVEAFDFNLTWELCYCILYEFCCVTQHCDPTKTLTSGALRPDVRKALKLVLEKKKSKVKSEADWARDMLNLITDCEACTLTKKVFGHLTSSQSYALGLWFPRMVKVLATKLTVSLCAKFLHILTKKSRRTSKTVPAWYLRWWANVNARLQRQIALGACVLLMVVLAVQYLPSIVSGVALLSKEIQSNVQS